MKTEIYRASRVRRAEVGVREKTSKTIAQRGKWSQPHSFPCEAC